MKDFFKLSGILLATILLILGIGGCKYQIWRAEHPQASTWTFFIPR